MKPDHGCDLVPGVPVEEPGDGSGTPGRKPLGMRWGWKGGALCWVSGDGLGRREAWRCGLGRGMGEQVHVPCPEAWKSREGGDQVCREGGQALEGFFSEMWSHQAPGAGCRWAG